jgi:putative heme iron utilization protein
MKTTMSKVAVAFVALAFSLPVHTAERARPAPAAMPTPAAPPAATVPGTATPLAATGTVALCATAAQADAIPGLLAQPRANYWGVATTLGTTEAAVLAGVAARTGAATDGAAFVRVWESLRTWREAVTIVMKGGHVLEVHGRVNEGVPSTQSRYFNLKGHDGVSGHLRPDLVAGIYAVTLPGRNGPEYGIAFADGAGSVAFAVYLPAGEDARAGDLASWQATRDVIAAAAPLCGAPAAARP